MASSKTGHGRIGRGIVIALAVLGLALPSAWLALRTSGARTRGASSIQPDEAGFRDKENSGATASAGPVVALDQGFRRPPDSAKPRVYWWWLFNRVDKAGITHDLEEFKAKGIGGVNLICTGGYAGKAPLPGVPFLGPEWRELFRHAVKEAARLDIELGFNLAGGWVMIGPWVTQDNAMKRVVQSELNVRGPQKFAARLPLPPTTDGYYRDVWVQAFPAPPAQSAGRGTQKAVDPGAVLDITDRWRADGVFEWDVPAGDWTILRTGYTLTGSRWDPYPMGDTFEGGAGYQIDYLDPLALDDHFGHLGRLVLDETRKVGGRLDYLWSDSWECGKLTWTRDFPALFARSRGYDPKPYMPSLSGHTVGDSDVTARFKADFDRTVEDAIADNFYGHFADLCHREGVRMGSEAAGPGNLPPMDSLKNLGRCDVPGGEFWVNDIYNFAGGADLNLKQTASAAHIYGRPRALAESFTQQEPHKTHWYYGPADLKPFGDCAFLAGINAIMLHMAVCQPPGDGKPGYQFCAGQHWDPNITWWEQSGAFFDYLARCQFMLQQGLFVADSCVFLGEEPPVIAPPKVADPEIGLGSGYDADFVNADVLVNRMSVRGGRLVLPDGMSYRLLALRYGTTTSPEVAARIGAILSLPVSAAPPRAMSVELAKKVRQLVADGATVVGPPPVRAAGLRGYPACDDEVRRIAAEVWGDCDGRTRTEHSYGKGRVIWGRTPREVLAGDGIGPDFAFQGRGEDGTTSGPGVIAEKRPGKAMGALDFIHRSAGGAEIYFVANRTDRSTAHACAFRVRGLRPEIWDPVSGETRRAAAFETHGGVTTVPLEFAPWGSLFVVFRKPAEAGSGVGGPDAGGKGAGTESARRNFPALRTVQEIRGGWTVAFDPRWGGPASIDFPELVSWTRRLEDGIKYYSGKAVYRTTFDLEKSVAPEHGKMPGHEAGSSGLPGGEERRRVFLDMGDVRHVAEVRLNGRRLGVLWTAPWRVEITDVIKPEGNVLEVDVVNLWANRVIGDLGRPKEKRIAVTHEAFRFDMITKDTPLVESGLLGPVRLLIEP
jgi:hypothetical protein